MGGVGQRNVPNKKSKFTKYFFDSYTFTQLTVRPHGPSMLMVQKKKNPDFCEGTPLKTVEFTSLEREAVFHLLMISQLYCIVQP